MAKRDSDIFICRLGEGDYWAYPSPFVAHGCNSEIQFRNLTNDILQIDLGTAPVHKRELSLGPGEADSVNVNGDAKAGLHEYRAVVKPKKAVAGQPLLRAGKTGRAAAARKASKTKKPGPIVVRGSSPPRIIIDT